MILDTTQFIDNEHFLDSYFNKINTEEKAYILGLIAAQTNFGYGYIDIYVNSCLSNIIQDIFNVSVYSKILIDTDVIRLKSDQCIDNICHHLQIDLENNIANNKCYTGIFPVLSTDDLKYAFIRGIFDICGSIVHDKTSIWCTIPNVSKHFTKTITTFSDIPFQENWKNVLLWSDNNALDFLSKLYHNATIYSNINNTVYWQLCSWVPGLNSLKQEHSCYTTAQPITFKWVKTRPDAVAPHKVRASDSGYDITILEEAKKIGNMTLYHTGIKVCPEYGWYIDIVPRSSIIKTGRTFANCTAIIDRTYTGEIMIALIKHDPDALDLQLPLRIGQMIPRPIVNVKFEEVESFDNTARAAGGFGSTG